MFCPSNATEFSSCLTTIVSDNTVILLLKKKKTFIYFKFNNIIVPSDKIMNYW